MTSIMIVNPNTTTSMTDLVVAGARAAARPGTVLIGATPTRGVHSVESNVDEVWGAVGVLEVVGGAERTGVDGFVIACFGDTGVHAARELARGPVVGMTEAALFTASLLAARFAIVTLPPRTAEQSHRVLRETGLTHRCSVRTLDVPVSDLAEGSGHLLDAVAEQGRAAIGDGAEAVVLGCAGFADLVGPLTDLLDVPVIEGVSAAVTMVEGLLAQGLRTSRAATYLHPERRGPS